MESKLLSSAPQNENGRRRIEGQGRGVPPLTNTEIMAKGSVNVKLGEAVSRAGQLSSKVSPKTKRSAQTGPNEPRKAVNGGELPKPAPGASQKTRSGAPVKQHQGVQLNADIVNQVEADLTADELMSISASPMLEHSSSRAFGSDAMKPIAVMNDENGEISNMAAGHGRIKKRRTKEALSLHERKPKNEHYPYAVPDPEVRPLPTIDMPVSRPRAARVSPKTRMDTERRRQLETDPLVEQFVGQEDAGLDKEIDEHMMQMNEPLRDLLQSRLSDAYVASMAETTEKFQNEQRAEHETAIEKLVDVKTLLRGRALDEGDVALFKSAVNFSDQQCDDLMQAKADQENRYEKFDEKVESTEGMAAESDEPEAQDAFWEKIDRKHDRTEDPFTEHEGSRFRFKGRAIDEIDDVDHTVAKPTLRELVKEYESQQRTHYEEPLSHEERMRQTYERKFATLRRAAAAMQRDSVALVKERSRQLIKKTTKRLSDLFKKETVALLGQMRAHEEDLDKRDQQLTACHERMKLLERKVVEYSQMFKAMNMTFNLSERELWTFFGEVMPGRQATLDEDLARYTQSFVDNETWEEPPAIAGVPNLLRRPFEFYGGYVSLSSQEKGEFAANATVFKYKSIIKDLSEANQALEASFDYMKKLKEQREEELKDLQAQLGLQGLDIAKKEQALRQGQAIFEKTISDMKAAFADARRKQGLAGQQEREVLEQELALAREIQTGHRRENEQLRYELKEAKKIIKIPRLHYRNIENSDFAGILSQYDRIAKMAAEMEPLAPGRTRQTGVEAAEEDQNLKLETKSKFEGEIPAQSHDIQIRVKNKGSNQYETRELQETQEPRVRSEQQTDHPPPTREGRGESDLANSHLLASQHARSPTCSESFDEQAGTGEAQIPNLEIKYKQQRSSRTPIAPVASQHLNNAFGVTMPEFSTFTNQNRQLKEERATKQGQQVQTEASSAAQSHPQVDAGTTIHITAKRKCSSKAGNQRRAASVLTRTHLATPDYMNTVRLKNLPFLNLQLKTTKLELAPPFSNNHTSLLPIPASRPKATGSHLLQPQNRQYHPFVKDPADQRTQPQKRGTTLGRLPTSHARHGSQFLPTNDKIWKQSILHTMNTASAHEHRTIGLSNRER